MKKDNKNPLLAISTAALSLPGMIPSLASAQDAMSTEKVFSYRYSAYSEDPIPASATLDGEGSDRYEIDVHHLRFSSPITDSTEIALQLLSESMSGASPRYVLPVDGEAIQVMSNATIEEERMDLDISFTSYSNTSISTTALSYSDENDYSSFGLRTKYAWFFNEKNTSFELGASVSQDFIDASQDTIQLPTSPNRVSDEEKTSTSVTVGISQILSKTSIVSTSFNLATFTGYMSDPYKEIYISNLNDQVPDSRPDRRNQWSWTTQYRHHFKKLNGSLHADYRYFSTNWDTISHTIDLRWLHNFGDGWVISPSIRYYDQGAAAFFQNWYDFQRADGFHSSDYRLSDYHAVSGRIKISKTFKSGAIHLSFEDYTSEADENNPQLSSPSLVSFSHLSIGFDYGF